MQLKNKHISLVEDIKMPRDTIQHQTMFRKCILGCKSCNKSTNGDKSRCQKPDGEKQEVWSSPSGQANYCKSIGAFLSGESFVLMKLKDVWSFIMALIKRDSNDLTRGKLPALKMSFRCRSECLDNRPESKSPFPLKCTPPRFLFFYFFY